MWIAVSRWIITGAVATSVTAVIAIIAAVVAVKALDHEKVQTGTKQPLIARAGSKLIPWNAFDKDPLPDGWDRHNTRWVPIRLINRARYNISAVGPRDARLGIIGRVRVEVKETPGTTVVKTTDPVWRFVRLYKPEGWGKPRKKYWLRVSWEAAEGRVTFRGRVELQTPPEIK